MRWHAWTMSKASGHTIFKRDAAKLCAHLSAPRDGTRADSKSSNAAPSSSPVHDLSFMTACRPGPCCTARLAQEGVRKAFRHRRHVCFGNIASGQTFDKHEATAMQITVTAHSLHHQAAHETIARQLLQLLMRDLPTVARSNILYM